MPTSLQEVAVPTASPLPAPSRQARAAAWAVHALTMSGLPLAFLAILALIRDETGWMWLWLALAMLIDGVDGTCARRARVKDVIPWFDGSVVDIVVDYLTWTFIPALFMYLHLPLGPAPVAGVLTVTVLVSSLFCYANEGEKSSDNYFVGFPAAWNIVAVMLWALGTPAVINVVVTLLFVVLTLVPTHYVHPARVKRLRVVNITAVGVWLAGTAWLVTVHPVRPLAAVVLSLGGGAWLLLVGALRSARGAED